MRFGLGYENLGGEALARQGASRVTAPISSAAGLPAQPGRPDEVLRDGREMTARFRCRPAVHVNP